MQITRYSIKIFIKNESSHEIHQTTLTYYLFSYHYIDSGASTPKIAKPDSNTLVKA